MDSTTETHDVVVTRVFDAPLEQVWQAWADPEMVKQWWGPKGFTCTLARMDFRAGGTSLVGMRAPAEFGGQDYYNTWTYTQIVPRERFEYVTKFTDQHGTAFDPAELGLPPSVPKEVLSINTFRGLGDGRTEVRIMEHSFPTAEAAALSRQGLEECLDKMAACLAEV